MKKLNRETLKNMGAGLVISGCPSDLDVCPPGSHCHNGKCYPDDPIGPCFNDECPPGYHCRFNICVR